MPSPRRARADPAHRGDGITLIAGPALAAIGVGLAIALAGFAAVGPPLAVPGAALVALGALSMLTTYLVAAGVHVQGRPLDATVTEGQLLHLELTVTGHRVLGLGGATLEHSLLSEPFPLAGEMPAARGPGRGEGPLGRPPGQLILTARAGRRGRLVIPSPRLTVADPLGLVHAQRGGAGTMGELLVLPRIEPVHWHDGDIRGAAAHARTATAGTEATDLAGLRDYQPGTPATRIYWPALARGGNLLERFFEGEVDIAPLVILDPRGGYGSDETRCDTVIRAAASLTVDLARVGAVDLLLPGRPSPVRISEGMAGWRDAHQAMALIDRQPAAAVAPPVPADRAGVLFYACAYPTLALTAQRRWSGRMLTLTPREAGTSGPMPVAEVAGCVATAPGSA